VEELRASPRESLSLLELAKLWHFDYRRATQSRYWRKLKVAVVMERGARCEECGRVDAAILQLHHLTYVRLGAEWPEDVRLLCVVCHWREHRPVSDHLVPAEVWPDG
jgi:hypothetical protein